MLPPRKRLRRLPPKKLLKKLQPRKRLRRLPPKKLLKKL
jgi:hypothetical protein